MSKGRTSSRAAEAVCLISNKTPSEISQKEQHCRRAPTNRRLLAGLTHHRAPRGSVGASSSRAHRRLPKGWCLELVLALNITVDDSTMNMGLLWPDNAGMILVNWKCLKEILSVGAHLTFTKKSKHCRFQESSARVPRKASASPDIF